MATPTTLKPIYQKGYASECLKTPLPVDLPAHAKDADSATHAARPDAATDHTDGLKRTYNQRMGRPTTFWKAKPIIEKTLLRHPATSRAALVRVLAESGIPERSAYRHVSTYYRGTHARKHLPEQQEVLVRVSMALEENIRQTVEGEAQGSVAALGRLYMEAHGLLDPIQDGGLSEEDRLAAAALAVARLRGYNDNT